MLNESFEDNCDDTQKTTTELFELKPGVLPPPTQEVKVRPEPPAFVRKPQRSAGDIELANQLNTNHHQNQPSQVIVINSDVAPTEVNSVVVKTRFEASPIQHPATLQAMNNEVYGYSQSGVSDV